MADVNDTSVNQNDSTNTLVLGSNSNALMVVVIPLVFALIAVLGFIGNTFVIIVIVLNKHMRNSTNALLLNLAIADLTYVVICIPFTAYQYTEQSWMFGGFWCRFIYYSFYVSAWASVWTLVLLGFDRLFAVVYAIQFPHVRTRRNTVIALVILWLVCALVNIPAFIVKDAYLADGQSKIVCARIIGRDYISKLETIYSFCFFVSGYVFPVIIISIVYIILLHFLSQRSGPIGNEDKGLKKTKKRITLMVLVVIIFFVVCWMPIQVLMILAQLGIFLPTTDLLRAILTVANCLSYLNSCVNPILYALCSTTFRKAYKDLLCCKLRRKQHEVDRFTECTRPPKHTESLNFDSVCSNRRKSNTNDVANVEQSIPLVAREGVV